MAKKFIVRGEDFIMGNVELHRDLVEKPDGIEGGGFWELDRHKKIMYLYSKSYDFGSIKKERIVEAFKTSYISGGLTGYKVYYHASDDIIDCILEGEFLFEVDTNNEFNIRDHANV